MSDTHEANDRRFGAKSSYILIIKVHTNTHVQRGKYNSCGGAINSVPSFSEFFNLIFSFSICILMLGVYN